MASESGKSDGKKLPKDINDSAASAREKIDFVNKNTNFEADLSKPYDFLDLLSYDFENDPNRLIGPLGWITKGSHALWIGQSGIGKSSMCFQLAIRWALGLHFFGILPMRALRCLILQSEDDIADMARCAQGITFGYELQGSAEKIKENVLAFREELRGDALEIWLRRHVQHYKPDIVFINPLLAFCDGDISKEPDAKKVCSIFNGIARDYGTSFQIFHHTPKPREEDKGQDYDYFGFGSSYLTNWARAIMVIRKLEDRKFELRAEKRGARAGMKDAKGNPARTLELMHGENSVFWAYNTKPTADAQGDLTLFRAAIGTDERFEPLEYVIKNVQRLGRYSEKTAGILIKRLFVRYRIEGLNTAGLEKPIEEGGFVYKSTGRDKYLKLIPKEKQNGGGNSNLSR